MKCQIESENSDFLTSQIITYIGNKRQLIYKIEPEVQQILKKLGKDKAVCADLFSGSGIVARMLKKYSKHLIANDLENYSAVLNGCYLSNKSDFPSTEYEKCRKEILQRAKSEKIEGIIAQNYAPKDDAHIQKGERVFYTRENAILIDTYRNLIDSVVSDEAMRKFFLAPLITEASIHVNTSGVFKGFYKDKNTGIGCFGGSGRNALSRILGTVQLSCPVLSNFTSEIELHQSDTVELCKTLKNIDIAYLDPPYNQHPYGSNYFMLNLILKNRLDVKTSRVSGITQGWNRSAFNKKKFALTSLEESIKNLDAKYTIISYNSEGFITPEEMQALLKKHGSVKTVDIMYNTFRGSRNLSGRNIHVSEYLFILER